jgi:hypothetical protein
LFCFFFDLLVPSLSHQSVHAPVWY